MEYGKNDNYCDALSQRACHYEEAQLDILREMCSIDCGTGNLEGNRRIVGIVDDLLKGIGARVEHLNAPGFGTAVVGQVSPRNPTGEIVVSAHLDTVFRPGDVEKHPFQIQDGYVHALGAADCKGGVVTAIFGLRSLLDVGVCPGKKITFLFNCDEELCSPWSKKNLFPHYASQADYALCMEPSRADNGIITQRYGCAMGTMQVYGKSSHCMADYYGGASAVKELANLIQRLYEMNDDEHGVLYNVGKISASENTKINSIIPDYAAAAFCVTLGSEDAIGIVHNSIENVLPTCGTVPDCRIETKLNELLPYMPRSMKNAELYQRAREIGKRIGLKLPEQSCSGAGDANLLARLGVPIIDGLGPYMHDIHTTRERMLISSLPERTQLFAVLAAEL